MTNRREFLTATGALGCTLAASPLITPVVLASAPTDARLIVIILRGGLDGLDVVRPVGDPNLVSLRSLATDSLPLDGFYGLHPELADLMPLWASGELGFVHAVSTPYRNKRSHFDGQDFLENGGADPTGQMTDAADGWLNRLLGSIGGVNEMTAFAVGRERLRLLSGDALHSSWSPEADLDLSAQGQLLLELIYKNDPLFHNAAAQAMAISDSMTDGAMSAAKAGRAQELARFTAERLNAETRIAAFSLSGFDTHRNQSVALPRALRELQTALLTLKTELGANWKKTAVLAMTEFGRTARENGSKGTDHGTGGVMITAGGAIRGGIVRGQWPGLDEASLFDRRDLMPTGDVREYAGWIMSGMFGVATSDIERKIFPGVDMTDDPGFFN